MTNNNIDRDEMSIEQEREYVLNFFKDYETIGFSQTYHSPYTDNKSRIGSTFTVLRRATEEDCDLCCLPQWIIQFEDGYSINAYPEEIISIKENQ